MIAFAQLVDRLSATTKTNEKLAALEQYFATASDKDKVWVIALFSGRRPKRTISSTLLKIWCAAFCNIPLWLLEECYNTVGDLSETIALLAIQYRTTATALVEEKPLHAYIEGLMALEKSTEEEKQAFMLQAWGELPNTTSIFVFNKLLSGAFRIGVSQQLMVQALAKHTGLSAATIAHLISGKWNAAATSFNTLLQSDNIIADDSKPYPFYLAYPLEIAPAELGALDEWQIEWKWDGIRGQIIQRNGHLFVWSRGEELMTEKFPEYAILQKLLPNGTVLDGEIMVAENGKPLPFALLQTRIGRKNLSKKILDTTPVQFFAYDLLEHKGLDIRTEPLHKRRQLLEALVHELNHPVLQLSPTVQANSWQEITRLKESSRANLAEGFMLKHEHSIYQTGRKRGDWWKWKIDPLTIDAVMIYAQKGSGRRSNLYTDYTFAVKDGDQLVPFAKAYSGLTDKEFVQVDAFVKKNGLEKFGPVRTVKPALVFELAFEGIAASNRHKSGVALRFPRISRWRTDKTVEDINTLDDLKQMLLQYGS